MTGRYAHVNGLIGLANAWGRWWHLPDSERTTVDYLADAGYYTANFGGDHERRPGGYHYRQAGDRTRRRADQMADDVCAFLKNYNPKNGPFYLNAYSQDPHSPWDRPEFLGRYDPDKITIPAFLTDIPEARKELAGFYGAMSFTDEALGRIFATLRETGLDRNTLVIFTTDHGIDFPRAKRTLYDVGLTTAIIFRWPGHIQPGTVVSHLLSNVDLLPTQLELLGLSIPQRIQGKSFAGALTASNHVPHEQIFAERNFHNDFDPMRCVRTTRYKLIRNYVPMSRYKIPSEVTSEDTFATLYHHESGKPRPYEELYDLQEDPNEFHNLAADTAYATVLQDLRGRLDRWMNETGDFLRGGGEFVQFPPPQAQPTRAKKATSRSSNH